jgi:hypothetical protein
MLAASLITTPTKAASTAETSVNFYHTTLPTSDKTVIFSCIIIREM